MELLVTIIVAMLVFGFVARFFYHQRRNQQRALEIAKIQAALNAARWKMVQELKIARVLLWPRINADGSPRSDVVAAFRNFQGEIVTFHHDPATRSIVRAVVPGAGGAVSIDPVPVGRDIASAAFTAVGVDGRELAIRLEASNTYMLDSVRLVNE